MLGNWVKWKRIREFVSFSTRKKTRCIPPSSLIYIFYHLLDTFPKCASGSIKEIYSKISREWYISIKFRRWKVERNKWLCFRFLPKTCSLPSAYECWEKRSVNQVRQEFCEDQLVLRTNHTKSRICIGTIQTKPLLREPYILWQAMSLFFWENSGIFHRLWKKHRIGTFLPVQIQTLRLQSITRDRCIRLNEGPWTQVPNIPQ